MKIFKNEKKKFLLENIKKDINKAEVVSFDIFDTLLVRPYIRPTDLFTHMEKALECSGFENERRDAERRCRIRHKELEDITFDMIYDEIDEKFKDMKQKEMNWEEMVLRPNPELKQVYDYAQKLGKKIVIASDMYMPSEFLAEVLRKNGYDGWDKLYVSGELAKTKRRGSLFYLIMEENNYKAEQILHIGDNEYSDYDMPKVIGIKTVLYKKVWEQYIASNRKYNSYYRDSAGLFGASILIGLFSLQWQERRCNLIKEPDYWENMGYLYTGPLVYSFMQFVKKEAIEKQYKQLIFIARSGYVLKNVFETFKTEIDSKLVYAPRTIKAICQLRTDFSEEIPKLISYFVEKDEILKNRYLSLNSKDAKTLRLFYESNEEKFQQIASENWELFNNYIKSAFNSNESFAIVDDMGWHYSAQDLIEKSLGKSIKGLYFIGGDVSKYEKALFSDTYVKKRTYANLWTWKWRFVEFLLSAPINPVVDITKNGFEFKEVDVLDKVKIDIAEIFSNQAVNFAKDVNKMFNGYNLFIEYESVTKWINSFLWLPDKRDYQYFEKIDCDWKTFNTDSLPFLVMPRKFKEYFIWSHKPFKGYNANFFWQQKGRALLFEKFTSDTQKYIRILGITVYKKLMLGAKIKNKILGITFSEKNNIVGYKKFKFLYGLFKTLETNEHKKYYILGIQVFCKHLIGTLSGGNLIKNLEILLAKTERELVVKFSRLQAIAFLHQKTFAGYKNKYHNQSVVLMGAGPTLNHFVPIKKSVYVGLNRTFLFDKIKFDYLFSIDKAGIENYYKEFAEYKGNNCIKFIGDQNMGIDFQIPESYINELNDVKRYATAACLANGDKFAYNLEIEPLANSCTVSLQAMQFILYTNPKKVYIVGIDCNMTKAGHFVGQSYDTSKRNENSQQNDAISVKDWKRLKTFAETYYPETEIISVNPVGLRGIFKDVYTESYLKDHPELLEELGYNVEILKDEDLVNV